MLTQSEIETIAAKILKNFSKLKNLTREEFKNLVKIIWKLKKQRVKEKKRILRKTKSSKQERAKKENARLERRLKTLTKSKDKLEKRISDIRKKWEETNERKLQEITRAWKSAVLSKPEKSRQLWANRLIKKVSFIRNNLEKKLENRIQKTKACWENKFSEEFGAIKQKLEKKKRGKKISPARRKGERAVNTDTVNYIFQKTKRYKLIDKDEEQELAKEIIVGNKEALDKLILANLRLVINIAKRFMPSGVPLEDLINYGNLGLIEAAKKFKHSKNCKFSTYATYWITQQIDRGITDNEKTIRLPIHKDAEIKKIKRYFKDLPPELNELPDISEVAVMTKMKQKKVSELNLISSWKMLYLDASIKEDNKGDKQRNFGEVTNLPSYPSPEENVAKAESAKKLKAELKSEMDKLTEREQFVLKKRFMEMKATPLDKIGEQLNISRERVRQIESKALKKLYKKLSGKKNKLLLLIA